MKMTDVLIPSRHLLLRRVARPGRRPDGDVRKDLGGVRREAV